MSVLTPPPSTGRIAAIVLILTVLLRALDVYAASFNCTKAKAPDERAICADPGLSNLDSRLAGLLDLDEGTAAIGQRGGLQDEQSAWVNTRTRCSVNSACLHARYESRLKQVTDHLTQRLCGKDGPPC